MRDYGIVRTRFWAWAKDKGLSPAARELALYCLTSPHTTGAGCFRLPIAYIAEDLGTVPETVRQTVSELSQIGFLQHDESTGWVWIVGFLDHNPIANPNVGKSLMHFIEAVPKKVPFYGDFLASLSKYGDRFPNGFLNGLRNGMANGSANGMPNHEHEHEHEHEIEHDHDGAPDGAADAADREAEPRERSAEQLAFDTFVETAKKYPRWPVPTGMTEPRRKALGARLRDVGSLEGFKAVLAKAEASSFIRDEMTGWGIDWFLKAANFAKVREGNYDNNRRVGPVAQTAESHRAAWAEGQP
ncbi:MAG TPA: hypothetical protein VFB13_19115 [Reyranella sp.]|nr:hypothetical protein [Reyranella sp.]